MTDLSKMSHAELKAQSVRDKKAIDEAPDRTKPTHGGRERQTNTTRVAAGVTDDPHPA